MRHDHAQNSPQEMDTWLSSLVNAFEQVSSTDVGVVPCHPISDEALPDGVLKQLARPVDDHPAARAALSDR